MPLTSSATNASRSSPRCMRRGRDRAGPQAERAMTDEQFRIIRGLLVTMVILLGLITGLPASFSAARLVLNGPLMLPEQLPHARRQTHRGRFFGALGL